MVATVTAKRDFAEKKPLNARKRRLKQMRKLKERLARRSEQVKTQRRKLEQAARRPLFNLGDSEKLGRAIELFRKFDDSMVERWRR